MGGMAKTGGNLRRLKGKEEKKVSFLKIGLRTIEIKIQ